MAAPKVKKPKIPKKKDILSLPLEKQRETLFTLYFLKPFVRRIGYWYKGLNIGHGANFVLGSEPEAKFSHGNPSHAISLVSIKNPEHIKIIDGLFQDIGLMNDNIEIVDMKNLATQLGKVKWDTSKIKFFRGPDRALNTFNETLEEGKQYTAISNPLVSLFVLQSIGNCVSAQFNLMEGQYKDALQKDFHCDDSAYEHVTISPEEISKVSHIASVFSTEIRFIGIRGLDLLQIKPFKGEEDITARYVFWRPTTGPVLDYFHVLETPDVRITATRLFVFLFPKTPRK